MKHIILKANSISNSINSKKILNNININIFKGEFIALVGLENSGKTMLAKTLAGMIPFDEGILTYDSGKSIKRHIFYIGQETDLISNVSIKDNIFIIARERNASYANNKKAVFNSLKTIVEKINITIDINTFAKNLPIEIKHIVLICAALVSNANIIILDSITGSYSQHNLKELIEMIKILGKMGLTTIYLNNNLDSIFKHAERVFILKKGSIIWNFNKDDYTEDKVVRLLSGYDNEIFNKKTCNTSKKVIMRIDDMLIPGLHKHISFSLKMGEILGFAVNEKNMRQKIGNGVFGLSKLSQGKVFINDTLIKRHNPNNMLKRGIGYIPENAIQNNLFFKQSIADNAKILIPLKIHHEYGFINQKIETYVIDHILGKTDMKGKENKLINSITNSDRMKIMIYKLMVIRPKAIIIVNPTQDMDMMGIKEIYSLLLNITKSNISIILISSNIDELIDLSDRIVIFEKGFIKSEIRLSNSTIKDTREKILDSFLRK